MTRRGRAARGALLAVALVAAACGDDGGTDGGNGDGEATGRAGGEELTPITVGILPLAGLAPLYHGVEQGYFADEGLDVSM